VALSALSAMMSSGASLHRSPSEVCQRLHLGQPLRRSPQWSISTNGWSQCLQRLDDMRRRLPRMTGCVRKFRKKISADGGRISRAARYRFATKLSPVHLPEKDNSDADETNCSHCSSGQLSL